ncbi:MAG: hypothetical protein V4677_08465 [Bacteroidota bacterium]
MEENLILENNPVEQPKRSQFLKVLCILSFVMCGIMFLLSIWGIYQSTPEAQQKNIEQFRTINPEMADQMEDNMIEMMNNPFAKIKPYLDLVYLFISFLGVMMMWNLKRTGFYVYAIAELLPYTGFLFLGSNALKMMGGPGGSTTIAMVMMIIMVVLDLAFIIMYSRNLKEMNK